MKSINIVACGSTGSKWNGKGESIGVNDAFKWGFELDCLILLNSPNQFTADRLNIIRHTKAPLYTNYQSWKSDFDDVQMIDPRQWSHSNRLQKISRNYLYHSKTSPFVGISLAFNKGYDEIILWGVDMVDHRTYKPGNGAFMNEYNNYKTFYMSLKDTGCNVYLGCEGSNLKFIPIYEG